MGNLIDFNSALRGRRIERVQERISSCPSITSGEKGRFTLGGTEYTVSFDTVEHSELYRLSGYQNEDDENGLWELWKEDDLIGHAEIQLQFCAMGAADQENNAYQTLFFLYISNIFLTPDCRGVGVEEKFSQKLAEGIMYPCRGLKEILSEEGVKDLFVEVATDDEGDDISSRKIAVHFLQGLASGWESIDFPVTVSLVMPEW